MKNSVHNHELLRLYHREPESGATYIGVTNDIIRRIYEHRTKAVPGFTSKYNITRLVWFEIYEDPISAISREKELKKWKRAWKIELIEARNPVERSVRIHLLKVIRDCRTNRPPNLEIPGSRFARPEMTSPSSVHNRATVFM